MINHSQARSMAEANWGRGGTSSSKTNTKGAFYFSCAGHGGYIIDGRAMSDEARKAISAYREPTMTSEVYEPESDATCAVFNPFTFRSRSIRAMPSWKQRQIEIWAFEEDCDWCLPVIFAGITTGGAELEHALRTFKNWMKPSNHQLLEAASCFKKHFPEHAAKAEQVLEPAEA